MLRNSLPFFLMLTLGLHGALFPQQQPADLDSLKKKFESFDFKTAILLSEKILSTYTTLSSGNKIEILRMRAISQYSLWDENSAKESFKEILKVDNKYELDSLKNSPKIISFFKSIKREILTEPPMQKTSEEKINIDSLLNREKQKFETSSQSFRTSFAKSLLLPGWGHLHNSIDTKGWILLSSTALTLGTSVYFSFDSFKKEKDYLAATNPQEMDGLYNRYNSSYKLRNISLISLALVWIYSQIDFAFISNNFIKPNSVTLKSKNFHSYQNYTTFFNLSFSF